jgi:hypothetical protein
MDTDQQHPNTNETLAEEVDRMTNEGGPDISVDTRSRFDRLMTYAREHPRLSVLGVAGLGLFGGLEVAAAVLLGAGIAAVVKLPDRAPPIEGVRDRARQMFERARNAVTRPDGEH